ncbi:cell envelope integrity protein TolA [Mammaliicoccus sciuri]|uniref:cell envelope integrity protein TolA n=1 Tax=Mammaliicoccus sciuri TaxID=1296 RepID=UPI00197EAC1F|nr:cell envelope integrity protein TolA [Mammaliicoccus sciuri]
MSSLLFALLWVVISIGFITTLIITVVKYAKEKHYSSYLVSTILLFVIGVISFVCIFVSLSFDKEYSYQQLFKEDKPKAVKHVSDTPKKDLKNIKLGDKIIVDGLEVTVTKAEVIQPDDGYSYSQNGKILKINYKFKNLEKGKKLIDNSNFQLTIDDEVQPQFNGMKDNKGGFQHQLDKGESKTSYLYYDVAESDKYEVKMNYETSKKTYNANWRINDKDIKDNTPQENPTEEINSTQEAPTYEQRTIQQPNNNADEEKKAAEAEKKRKQEEADKEAKEKADKKAEEEKAAKEEEEKRQEEADKKAEEAEQKQQEAEKEKAQQAAEQKKRDEQAAAEREKQQQQQQRDQEAQREKDRAAQDAAQKAKDRSNEQKQSQNNSNEQKEH